MIICLTNSKVSNVPTGIIHSTKDFIAPQNQIDLMINHWSKTNKIETMVTDSKHLVSFRDYPEEYTKFCQDIYQK